MQLGPLSQRFAGGHVDAQFHPPLDCLQDHQLIGGGVGGHQPSGEALVAVDLGELGHIAVAHRHSPRDAGVEVVVHADGELGFLFGGSHDGAGLCGVSIPGVVDAVRVADGFDLALKEIWEFPARPACEKKGSLHETCFLATSIILHVHLPRDQSREERA